MIYQEFATPGDALAHFGTKGMKWGVRKAYVPTPRDKTTVGDPVSAAIGAVYVGIFLGVTAIAIRDMHRLKNDSGKKIAEKNKAVAWKKNDSLKQAKTVDDIFNKVVVPINPKYPAAGTKMNCRRATFTYEMRRRGNDVEATRSHFATGQDFYGLKQATNNFNNKVPESGWGQKMIASEKAMKDMTPEKRSETIFAALKAEPNGSRGELGVAWDLGGGHSMAYEVIGGKPVIFDTQSRQTYRDPKSFKNFAGILGESAYTRTDNLKMDDQFLRRWMVNAEQD